MFKAMKGLFACVCLLLSIQAVVTAVADIDHVKEALVTVPAGKINHALTSRAAVLNGPVVIANQASAVSANLRKKEEIKVDLEDVTPFAVGGPYQVELVYYWPSLNNPDYTGAGVATIGPSVEYPAVYNGIFSVNMRLRKMIITYLVGSTWTGGVDFNGPMVTSLTSGANLPRPAYFVSSTTNPGTLTSTPTTIALNWEGLSFISGDVIVIGW